MKIHLTITLLSALFNCNFIIAQTDTSIRTEVFELSTCEPNSLSLKRQSESGVYKKMPSTKLESRTNKPSVLKITCINPLRYKYYINNEAVTQFMESSPLTVAINTFTNGDYLIGAPEIKIPEIFKTDSISSNAKMKIRDFQNKNAQLKKSIDSIRDKLQEIWATELETSKDSTKSAANYFKDPDYIKANSLFNKLNNDYASNWKDYQIFVSNLPLNNPRFGILQEYINYPLSGISEIDTIQKFQKDFSKDYLKHTQRFKSLNSLLSKFDNNSLNEKETDSLDYFLQFYNFKPPTYTYTFRAKYDYNATTSIITTDDVREQILNKKFQLYEEFVLNVATQIGVLVQNQFREYSSFNNAIENFSFIDSIRLDSIKSNKSKLIKTFAFIQRTNAELQILVSYLDINTELYSNVAKKINTNYLFLLSYLKNLDYLTMGTTELQTLPTATNNKNIDLIKYTVKREDKVTNTIQTYNYDFWLRGGLKIDFSVGFFATRLTDNVYNKVLVDTIGGSDSIRITRQDNGRTDFAFGGMVHVTPRNGASWLNIGGSVGVAYSSNQKLQVLAGLSLHFGKTERLILNAGAAFGTIKYIDVSASDFKFYENDLNHPIDRNELSGVKEKDRIYVLHSPDIKFASYNIPTVEKFVVRPFIGISYNLSKKNALQAVSGIGVKTFSDNYSNSVSY